MKLHIRFWINEIPLRLRSWWIRHWWSTQRRLLIEERDSWKRWCLDAEERNAELISITPQGDTLKSLTTRTAGNADSHFTPPRDTDHIPDKRPGSLDAPWMEESDPQGEI